MKIKVKGAFLNFMLILACSPVFAQLSENSTISLITIGPGKNVYSAFGHSAMRITDAVNGIDDVYNYGTFVFDEDFYVNFAKGENDYWLSIVPFQREYYIWAVLENRNVIQQKLNLSLKQKNDLYKFLKNNALTENSVYRYDYFYDNCSNRIDNALKKVFKDSLTFYADQVVKDHGKTGSTIRQLTHAYLAQSKWGELGIETCLGIEMDRKITPEQFKFLPDFLMWNYDKAKIKSNGKSVPLVAEKTFIYKNNKAAVQKTLQDFFSPLVCFCIILSVALFLCLPFANQTFYARFFDFLLFLSCGFVGFLLLFLWFFTSHYSQVNLNLIWANPLSLFLSFAAFSRKLNKAIFRYYFYYGCLLILTILAWTILPQQLNLAYLPLCLALALRSFSMYQTLK